MATVRPSSFSSGNADNIVVSKYFQRLKLSAEQMMGYAMDDQIKDIFLIVCFLASQDALEVMRVTY